MRSYTVEEVQALEVFKGRLTDLNLDDEQTLDANFIRWLRARDLNVDKAEGMFRQSLKWRKENDVDLIMNWNPPEILDKLFGHIATGFDDEGSQIIINQTKRFDVNVLWSYDVNVHTRYVIQNSEKSMQAMREHGSPVRDVVIIYDMDGFNLSHVMNRRYIEFSKSMSSIMEANYPEVMKAVYVVNTPRLFSFAWTMVKKLMPEKSISKVNVFGCNKEEWVSALLQNLPADQLPAMYGGTNQDFDYLS